MGALGKAATWLAVDFPRRYGRITQSKTYVPQIDGLRFLAIIVVVFYHATFRAARMTVDPAAAHDGWLAYLPNGAAGVELFFFISGYIIAFPFLNGSKPSLKAFYLRRLYRLEPPYLLVLVVCLLLVTIAGNHIGYAPQLQKSDVPYPLSFLASCFYLHQLLFQAPPRLNPPLWSLELEIQFYLLAPFLIAGYQRLGSRPRRMVLGLLAAVALLCVQVIGNRAFPYLRFTIFGNMYPFVIGIVLCDGAVARSPFRQPATARHDLLFLAGLATFLLSAALWYPWVVAVGTGLANLALRAVSIPMLFYGCARGRWARRLVGASWLALIGGACYSIYLVHVPVMQATANVIFRLLHPGSLAAAMALSIATLVPLSLVAGMIYYLLVERPCMRRNWPSELWAKLSGRQRPAVTRTTQSDGRADPSAMAIRDASAG